MPPGESCPSAPVLASFVGGRVTPLERRKLEEHLDDCSTCRRTVVGMLSAVGVTSAATTPSLPAESAELAPGNKVGRHIVVGRIGAGGMAQVYAAYDTTLDRKIALKFLSPTRATTRAGARLLSEASAMARLSHPNVVTVYDVGMWGDQPYLAMEYVEGQTLDAWARTPAGGRGRRPREILAVMAAVARGLEAAHAAGIVHRDVKPQNVLVTEGRVLVTDFGLSVRDDEGQKAAPAVAGTPLYMAPEQFAGHPATPATDVFGFCAMSYELLYGLHPFGGGSGDANELRTRVTAGLVRSPPPGRGVPQHVQRLVLAGLAADPAARPAGMGAVAAALLDDPARRRRRVGTVLLAGGAVAAAFWVGGYLKADPGRRCQAGAAAIDALWNAERRQQLSGGPRTATAALGQMLARRFDEYAGAWRGMFADTCRAAFTDRQISGELFDLRMSCLDGHRATFKARLESLPGSSAAQLEKVAASPLPPVAECAITERLSPRPLPADPASRARVARISEMLAQLDAARAQGDFARARRLATEATAAARSLGYQPLEARAINKLASVELRGIRLFGAAAGTPASLAADRAITLLEQAVDVAEAGRDDASRAEAATQLAHAHREAGRLAEAERWAGRAAAIVDRIGNPPLSQSALEMARGWIQRDRDQFDAARASFERALHVRQQLLGPRAPEVLASKTASCGAMMARDQRISCERESIALAQAIAGPRHPDLAAIKAALAYVLVDDAAHRDEACQLASEAVDIERHAVEANHIGLLRATLALAQCRRDQGRIEEARGVYLEAIRYATHPTAVRADLLTDYGVLVGRQGDYPQAITWMRKAVADYELVYGPTHHKPIETRQLIADRFRRNGKLREALKEADEAIAICERAGAMPLTYPELYQVKGLILMDAKRPEPARQALLRALELHQKVNTPELNRARSFSSLGEVEVKLGKLDDAIAHFETAMKIWTMESDPVYHGAVALMAADAAARQGRARWPRACELARRALTGYSQPWGQSMADAIAETKRFLATHRCGGDS